MRDVSPLELQNQYFQKINNFTPFFQLQTVPNIMTHLVAEITKAFLEKV